MTTKFTRIKFITRQMVRSQRETLFVFGDNVAREGYGGQAREMRGEENSVGIATKWTPSNAPEAFFSDKDLYTFLMVNSVAFDALLHTQRPIVWPADGLGTGLAQLDAKAPKLFSFLQLFEEALSQKT